MSLTTKDLQHIRVIVTNIVTDATSGLAADIKSLKTDVRELKTDVQELKTDMQEVKGDLKGLATKVDRMDSRLTFSTNLIQRDAFTRLDEHEVRITKLEQGPAPA